MMTTPDRAYVNGTWYVRQGNNVIRLSDAQALAKGLVK